MSTIRPLEPRSACSATWSWTALVAETAGLGAVTVLRVTLLAAQDIPEGHRLVVQEFATTGDDMDVPRASAQLTVSGAALRSGLSVQLFRNRSSNDESSYVVAWLEPGAADLDFDGLRALPRAARWIAHGLAIEGRARLVMHPAPGTGPRALTRAHDAAA